VIVKSESEKDTQLQQQAEQIKKLQDTVNTMAAALAKAGLMKPE
jgi:hypothetical protein